MKELDYKGNDSRFYQTKSLYATDPKFLDNLAVKFDDLPAYIQNLLYNKDLKK